MKLFRLSVWWLIPLAMVAAVAFTAGSAWAEEPPPPPPPPPACDSPPFVLFGRCNGRGYFTNYYHNVYYPGFSFEPYSWWWKDNFGINSANAFINDVRTRLFNPGYTEAGCGWNFIAWTPCTRAKLDVTGAAFVIGTMSGQSGPSFGSGDGGMHNGVAWARSNFNNWETLVRQYDSAGRVDWNAFLCFGNNHFNSIGIRWGHDHTIGLLGPECDFSIRFRGPGGQVYIIKKHCGNLTGQIDPLPPLNFQNNTRITGSVTVVNPGKTYDLNAILTNNGSLNSPAVRMIVKQTLGQTKDPRIANQSAPVAATTLGYPGNAVECANKQPCWYWTYPDLGIGQSRSPPFTFTVDDTAPADSLICFTPYSRPYNTTTPERAGTPYCVRVIVPEKPFVSTEDGDVHGGSQFRESPCYDPSLSSGNITGQVSGSNGSTATYAVSAGGDVNNFGSAKEANGNRLSFGNLNAPSGKYGVICRPDLAKKYLNDSSLPAVGNNLTSLVGISGPVVRVNGDLTLGNGTPISVANGQHVTIFVDGNVLIRSNLNYSSSGYTKAADIPAFGIIARRNIYIHPDVTNLDGTYSAGTDIEPPGNRVLAVDGIIDTCENGATGIRNDPTVGFSPQITQPTGSNSGASKCNRPLVVNGLLMGRTMFFRRTAGNVAGPNPTPAELIKLTGQLFLSPPPGFGSLSAQFQDQGERPPVF